jgi:hypothetical protein
MTGEINILRNKDYRKVEQLSVSNLNVYFMEEWEVLPDKIRDQVWKDYYFG